MKLSKPELRVLVAELLRSDADFDAFADDYVPEARRRFSDGMDRVRKTNVLLEYADLERLAERLLALKASMTAPAGGGAVRPGPGGQIGILFLAANPPSTNTLALGREVEQIEEKLGTGKHRDALALVPRWAARRDHLQRALLEVQPQVLHFSGHGTDDELVFEDGDGGTARVDTEALVDLISILKDNLRLVVLNACSSEAHAEALVRHVDVAIGMRRPIRDKTAIAFAASFYQAIAFGRSVGEAFRLGCSELRLRQIPEEQTPRMKVRAGVDAEALVLVGPAS